MGGEKKKKKELTSVNSFIIRKYIVRIHSSNEEKKYLLFYFILFVYTYLYFYIYFRCISILSQVFLT